MGSGGCGGTGIDYAMIPEKMRQLGLAIGGRLGFIRRMTTAPSRLWSNCTPDFTLIDSSHLRSPCPIREGQREYHCTTPRLRLFLKTLLRSKSGQWGIVVTRWDIRASPTHPYLSPPQFCFHAATESRIAS